MATAVHAPHPPPSPLRQGSITPMLGSTSPRTGSISPRSPRSPRRRQYRPQTVTGSEYDPMLDDHQQVYVMSKSMMETLRNSMSDRSRLFTDPKDKIGFHGPRRPLLHSYPMSPRCVGKAMVVTTYREKNPTTPRSPSPPLPQTKEGKALIRLAHDLRTSRFYDDENLPGWKKLRRAKNVAPPMNRFEKLAKEKGFILDGVALSSIQDDYAKVQPKLGPAIPPYNSHYDKHVRNYFTFKGVAENLKKTGQIRQRSVSIQGKAVDYFHLQGVGKDYIQRRNKDGAGNSKDLIDGHDQYLRDTKPMNTYNGKFGFRRNTPTLRNCPSPFGTASRSSTF